MIRRICTLAAILIVPGFFGVLACFVLLHDWADRRAYTADDMQALPASLFETAITRAAAQRQLCCDNSLTIDPDRQIMTFRIVPGQAAVHGSMRAEIRSLASRIGQRYRYRADVRAAEGWQFSPHPTIAMQWHATRDVWFFEQGRKPPLAIRATGTDWVIAVNSDAGFATPFATRSEERVIARFPMQLGTWESLEFEVLWSPDRSGRIAVHRNGKLIATDRGANCFNDVIGPYFKFGNYQPLGQNHGTMDKRVLSFRNVSWERIANASFD